MRPWEFWASEWKKETNLISSNKKSCPIQKKVGKFYIQNVILCLECIKYDSRQNAFLHVITIQSQYA